MSNSHAAVSLTCLGWVKDSLVVKSEPSFKGTSTQVAPSPSPSQLFLRPLLTLATKGRELGFLRPNSSAEMIILHYLYQWREVHIYMTWSYAWEVKHCSPCSGSETPQHQTFLHEIWRQYIIGVLGKESWAGLKVSAYPCTHESAWWITHLSSQERIHVIRTCWVPSVSSQAPMPGSQDEAVNNKVTAQPLKGQTSQFNPNQTAFSSVSSKPKAPILKIHSLKSYLSKTQEVCFGPLWNSIGREQAALCSISLVKQTFFPVTWPCLLAMDSTGVFYYQPMWRAETARTDFPL